MICFYILQSEFECHQFSSIFWGVMPLFQLRILEIHSFSDFSFTCVDILTWNIAYDFVLLYYRSRSSVANLRQFLLELCPFRNLEYWKYSFPHFDILIWNYFFFHILPSTFECHQFASIFVGVMPLLKLKIMEIHSFPHFYLTCFDILSWIFSYVLYWTKKERYTFGDVTFLSSRWKWIYGIWNLVNSRIPQRVM